MATTVHFTDKSGKASKITFPTRALAESYARTVKGARLEETGVEAVAVSVQKCPVATAEIQKAATSAYYRSVKEPSHGRVIEVRNDSEADAEHMAEHFADARAAGQTMEDAFKDWDFIRGLA